MCNYDLVKHFFCENASFTINNETGSKIPFCRFYINGKCQKLIKKQTI
jgi:hypothetical protein